LQDDNGNGSDESNTTSGTEPSEYNNSEIEVSQPELLSDESCNELSRLSATESSVYESIVMVENRY
jgi:hypothetical protein